MIGLRGFIYWAVIIAFYVHSLMMSDSCIIFKTINHVAIDMNLFQNVTESSSEWACVRTCHKNTTVSITRKPCGNFLLKN